MHARATDERRINNVTNLGVPLTPGALRTKQFSQLPVTRALTFACVASLVVAGLIAVVSAVGLAFGSLYVGDPAPAHGITTFTTGVLVPGFRAHDAFNRVVGRRVWTVDLAVEVPAMLAGGVLLWRRAPLGYVAGAGLLMQFGLTPVAIAAILALQPLFTAGPIDAGTIVGVLVFAAVCFAPIAWFSRGAVGNAR